MTNTNQTHIAVAIVIAGAFIAGGLFFGLGRENNSTQGMEHADNGLTPTPVPSALRPIEDTDHVLGNPDASITIFEFSDFECPFCGRLHPTLDRIVQENEDVNWVYRHFPLTSFHTRAYSSAHASECVASIGGNDAFWTYTNGLFANQHGLGTELYERLAQDVGIELGAFQSCMDNNTHEEDVNADLQEVQRVGGRGTPYSIVVNSDGMGLPFSGALPYETIQGIIEQLR